MKSLLWIALLFAGFQAVRAQLPSTGFNREVLSPLEHQLNQRQAMEHPVLQPAARYLETSFHNLADSSYAVKRFSSGIRVRPIMDISTGGGYAKDLAPVGFGYAGISAEWNHRERWTGTLGYALAGGAMPAYYERFVQSSRMIPGWGYAIQDQKQLAHAHVPFGHIGYKAGKYFHFEIGNGKHFWGDGRRSLIISDVAAPYPYLRIDTKVWNIKYTNLWARMDDFRPGQSWADRRGKFVALHGLSWNISKDVNLSLFEMVVWQDADSMSTRSLDLHYLNPVIFYRPVEYAQGSADNVLMGAGLKIKASNNVQLYAQIMIDEFLRNEVFSDRGWWANKFGGQFGVKWFNLFTPGLHIQAEGNVVRPFTYTHGSSLQAWGHLRQPLAHPFGANFYEIMLLGRYEWKGWTFIEEATWGSYGRDQAGLNQGGDIFKSYRRPASNYGNFLLQGERHVFHYHNLTASKSLGSKSRLELFVSHVLRHERGRGVVNNEHLLLVGIRSSGVLRNQVDF